MRSSRNMREFRAAQRAAGLQPAGAVSVVRVWLELAAASIVTGPASYKLALFCVCKLGLFLYILVIVDVKCSNSEENEPVWGEFFIF